MTHPLRVLIGCATSCVALDAFLARGHDAWQCDLLPADKPTNRHIPRLLALKAKLGIPWVGLSIEPLLGPVDLSSYLDPVLVGGFDTDRSILWDGFRTQIDWVIVGGESGLKARPMHPDWARSLRDQCQAAGVPFFFKQWGEWTPVSFDDLASEEMESLEIEGKLRGWNDQPMLRIGKSRAGRLLDGREWNNMPGALTDA